MFIKEINQKRDSMGSSDKKDIQMEKSEAEKSVEEGSKQKGQVDDGS